MHLRNLSIGTQLVAALVIILALVTLLGTLARRQSYLLWDSTHDLYMHPLAVRQALGRIQFETMHLHRCLKDVFLTDDISEQESLLQDIAKSEAIVRSQFDILKERYLRRPEDVDSARAEFERWVPIRYTTLKLFNEGKRAEAIRRTFRSGIDGAQVEKIYARLDVISAFAHARGHRLYSEAADLHEKLKSQLTLAVLIVFFLTCSVGYLLLRGIQRPVDLLTRTTDRFAHGHFDARSSYIAGNELGILSSTFNALADTIQGELHVKDSTKNIKNAVIGDDTIQNFCRSLLFAILKDTDSVCGAVYLHKEDASSFQLLTSVGLTGNPPASFDMMSWEGAFPRAYETREVTSITDIAMDAVFLHSTVAGDLHPADIVVIPLQFRDRVLAMLAVGSVKPLSAINLRIIDEIRMFLGVRLASVIATERVHVYAEKMDLQNRELTNQAHELARQADELSEQNVELALQKQALDEANRMKSSFLSNMSHELRTPLNSVIALSGVLNRRLRNAIPEEEYEYIDIIARNGRHLLSLINDVLDLSRIESGREDILFASILVQDLLNEVVDMLAPQAEEKGIQLDVRLPDVLPAVTTDAGKCRQILINLIGNAIKFTEQGSVRISVEEAKDSVCVVITDTGIGIAPDLISHVFEEFTQADDSIARKYGGTGLGLAIAQRYAGALQASIDVSSTLGIGSTFTLTLPLSLVGVADPAGTQTRMPHRTGQHPFSAEPTAHRKGACVLVVEDNEAARIQLREVLEREGYNLVFANDGAEVLLRIQENLPDAVILDLMMPEVNVFEVSRVIRSEERIRALPVLILTAKHLTHEELASLKGNQIHQLIQKGDVNKHDLLRAVAAMVAPEPSSPIISGSLTKIPKSRKPRVLIVEDNLDNLITIRAVLSETCQIIQATNGQESLDLARSDPPDLILLDIALPGLDGFKVLDLLKKDSTLLGIPVVALTARAMKGDRHEILSHGFDAYLSKPVDAQLLEHTINTLVYGNTEPDNPGC